MIIFGILLFIINNSKNRFSVGIPEYKFELIEGKIVSEEMSDTQMWTDEDHIYDMDLEDEEIYFVWAKDIKEAERKFKRYKNIGVATEYKFQTTTEQYISATLKNYYSSTKKTAILQNKIDFSESIDNIIIKNDRNIYTVYIDGDESEARNILDNYTHLEYIYPNSIINIPLINKDNYTYCIITVDRAFDLHFIIVIKDNTDNTYTVGFGNGADHLDTGYYSSPNSYSIGNNLYIKNISNVTDFNTILFTSWDKLDEISILNAEILGWKKSIWDIIILQV